MKALNGRFFDRAAHPFDLAVGPGVSWFGKALLNAPLVAELADRMAAHVEVMREISELNTVVGQEFINLVRKLGQDQSQEFHGHHLGGLGVQFGKGQLAGAVNGNEEVLLAFFRANFRKIDVEVADGIVLEFLFLVSSSSSLGGRRLMPWRCKQRCRAERLRCGMASWSA